MDSPDSYRISVHGTTQVSDSCPSNFAYRAITFSGCLSHVILLFLGFFHFMSDPTTPLRFKSQWFGLLPFRSPLLWECSLFLGVLRCFSSPGSLLYTIGSCKDDRGSLCRVSPFGDLRIGARSRLPGAYRSVPRPSSALSAKASTVSS